jgi:hypothetical protein
MKKKCSQCGAVIDTETDEFLNTASGILCINCANGGGDQFENSDSSEVDQNYL